jgi:hypothetical protein
MGFAKFGEKKIARLEISVSLDTDFIKDLTKLSRFPSGPIWVQQALLEVGIAVIIEPHLTGTHLDGAAIRHPNGFPVIALTLRHDRLDNFWLTLIHEQGHVKLHLSPSSEVGRSGGGLAFQAFRPVVSEGSQQVAIASQRDILEDETRCREGPLCGLGSGCSGCK